MASIFEKEYKALAKQLGVENINAVPKITRVVVNVGVGKQRDNKAFLEAVQKDIMLISGQKPHERVARKAVAGFAVRQGNLVGYRATLRGKRMEDFVTRFVNITLPRVRDFRGLRISALDGHGNLSVGVKEQLAFPEIHADKVDVVFGVEVTFVTSANNNTDGEALFRALGFPLTNEVIEEEEKKKPKASKFNHS
jgi:large subunit ribosomal protein L5